MLKLEILCFGEDIGLLREECCESCIVYLVEGIVYIVNCVNTIAFSLAAGTCLGGFKSKF